MGGLYLEVDDSRHCGPSGASLAPGFRPAAAAATVRNLLVQKNVPLIWPIFIASN